MYYIAGAIVWLVCGVAAAGFEYAYFQRAYPSIALQQERVDWWYAMSSILFGPFALAITYATRSTKYGWSLKRSRRYLAAMSKLVNDDD